MSVLNELMSTEGNLALLAFTFATVFLAAIGIGSLFGGEDRVARRLAGKARSVETDERPTLRESARESLWNTLLTSLVDRGGMMPKPDDSTMRLKLVHAGFLDAKTIRNYFALRLAMAIAAPLSYLVLVPFIPGNVEISTIMFTLVALIMAGFYIPPFYLAMRIRSRKRSISDSFPDTLDMLVVCVEAGLGLDAAITRVGSQISLAHPLLAEHLGMVALELRAGKSREDALRNLALRTGLPAISSFVTLLVQSENLGTSIAQTLRVHADEMRMTRMLKAEEKAHMLPVLLSVPLVTCILPAMISVILLPGGITVVRQVLPALGGG